MKNQIEISGRVVFDPVNLSNKHERQSEWKRVAMLVLDNGYEITGYYSWFVKKRYGIKLSKPIRPAHITFINDHIKDIDGNSRAESDRNWQKLKDKWNGKRMSVVVDVDIKTNGDFWWFVVPEEHRQQFHDIRKEIGLERPFFGLHMTIGRPELVYETDSHYFHNLFEKGLSY